MFRQALELDPEFLAARAGLAGTFRWQAEVGIAESKDDAMKYAEEEALAILEEDPEHVIARSLLGTILRAKGEIDASVQALARVVSLDPNYYGGHYWCAWALQGAGRYDDSIREYKLSRRIRPNYAMWTTHLFGASYLLAGKPEDALRVIEADLQKTNLSRRIEALDRLILALVYAETEREEDAREEIARVIELDKNMTISNRRSIYPFKDPAVMDSWSAAWRRLGLPEE